MSFVRIPFWKFLKAVDDLTFLPLYSDPENFDIDARRVFDNHEVVEYSYAMFSYPHLLPYYSKVPTAFV